MATIHISQEEAERDFAAVLKRLDAATSVVIEGGSGPVATVRSVKDGSLLATIARLRACAAAYADDSFAEAVQAGISMHREPLDVSMLDVP